MFGRTQRTKPIFVDERGGTRSRRALTHEDVATFEASASQRKQGTPDLYDIMAALDALKRAHPVEARMMEKNLRWLCKTADRELGRKWATPWQ